MQTGRALPNRPREAHGTPNRRVVLKWAGLAVLGAGLVVLPPAAARAHVNAGGPDMFAATYATQIQYGGPNAPWHNDAPLLILLRNRRAIVPASTAPTMGTIVSWSSANGNASITFFNDDQAFRGSAQFVGEGPVGYRGTLRSESAVTAPLAIFYTTQIQYGGPSAPWHSDAPLMLLLRNRRTIVSGAATPPTGTTVSWSSANGNGSITFFNDADTFRGSAQFPGEGPVGYRGQSG